MVILAAFGALACGFLMAAVLLALMTGLLERLIPSWADRSRPVEPGYAFVSLGWSLLAATAGGYTTAYVGATNPMQLVLALGVIFLVFSAMSAMQERGKQPIWFLLALVALTPLGALAGGLVRLRVLGVL
jgi:hypothetical protein